jgi:hypothetical protein
MIDGGGMKRITVLIVVAALALSAVSSAFDGQRKGFVIGGGVGAVPVAHWSGEYEGHRIHENVLTWGEHLFVGYGLNDRNIVALEINITPYASDTFNDDIIQGVIAPCWYHYFGKSGKSLFVVGGLGFSRMVKYLGGGISFEWNGEDHPRAPDGATGMGYLIGGGYEFMRHVQAAIYLVGGNPSERGMTYGIYHVAVMLTAVAF